MNTSGYRYSVVIPHYNSAEKLARLVNTIPEREDIEVLVVDDLSNSSEIEKIRTNVTLMNKARVLFPGKKLTAGGARNAGLELASGTWLLFADADDFFEPGAFDILDREVDAYGEEVDVFYFKVKGFRESGSGPSDRGIRVNRILDDFGEFSRFHHVVPWGKLVRHKLVADCKIRFEEVRFSNDVMFSAELAFASDAVRVVNEVLYNVEEGSSGLTSHKSEDTTFQRREVQLRHELLLFERLPKEFAASHRYVYYRKYLRDSKRFGSQRLRELQRQYEKGAGIRPLNLFRLRYFAYQCLKSLGLPARLIGSGPGAPYWARD